MAEYNNFSHLTLPVLYSGKPKLNGGGAPSKQTDTNKIHRAQHGHYLKQRTVELSHFWKERRSTRSKQNLPEISEGIPILLEIDPTADVEFLRGLGFEIICEIEDGFIIVATEDLDFSQFTQKADEFIRNISNRCNSPARIYALCEEHDRLRRILSTELYDKWAMIIADEEYLVDVGISCCGDIALPERPNRKSDESDEHFSKREDSWISKFNAAYIEWDDLKIEREDKLETFVNEYCGEIVTMTDGANSISALPDSFSARLKIIGKGLKDLVMNFPYIFEVTESEKIDIGTATSNSGFQGEDITILPPSNSDPIVCVIDSGIQEEHKYLASAIIHSDSTSLIPNNPGISDEVTGGGHGTRVAGAILYPCNIPTNGEYQLPCWIRNFRVLDRDNKMPREVYPPKEIARAVDNYSKGTSLPTKVYNHSIGSRKPCSLKHMSAWAAEIDSQSYSNDVLFIQAAGNVGNELIEAYWQAGYPYPEYLDREMCRISDPAQSLQALTVGSISDSDLETEDTVALGKNGNVSSFSRSGPGIWDVLKPEVVEFGGTHAYSKNSNPPILTTPPEVCPELIRKSPQGPAFARDDIGTSFSAPKVTYIASQIEKILPEAPALLYRALIAQSARWPQDIRNLTKEECISTLRHIGYGVPNSHRAISNDEYRVTLITPSLMELSDNEAHIFQVPIPEELSSIGGEYDILVEVTLSYVASPRRTRRHVKGYLSTWLDWCCSRIGESADTFSKRIFETGSAIDDDGNFKWVIGDAINRGVADGYSRKNGTLQKDWCIIKSNQLSDAFCIAVRGHKGWGGLFKAKYSLAVSFEAINQDVPIYEPIRNKIESVIESTEIEIEMSEK